MKTLVLVEWLRWLRTRRVIICLFVAAFVALSSPLLAYLLPDLLAMSADSEIRIDAPDPTWVDLLNSYFKTSSQVGLLVLAFVAGSSLALGNDDRLQLFYRSRTHSGFRVFAPRVAVTVLVLTGITLAGAALALYETWALISEVDLDKAIVALGVSSFGLVAFILLAAILAGLTNSPFASTLILVAVTFAGSLVPTDVEWSVFVPTRLLAPSGLLADESLRDYGFSAVVITALLAVSIGALLLRRLSGVPAARRRNHDDVGA